MSNLDINNIYYNCITNRTWNIFRPEVELYPINIDQRSTIIPKNIFEIGSHNGNDSEYLRSCYNIKHEDVFCFEANPVTFNELNTLHPDFNNINLGISNYNGTTTFNCVDSDPGVSSLRNKIHLKENDGSVQEINVVRMDYVMEQYDIRYIDICKIDVEGCAYEVLEGFGNKISLVKSFQIEAELMPLFQGQKLFPEISSFLQNRGFHMIAYFSMGAVCDTIWIRNDLFTIK